MQDRFKRAAPLVGGVLLVGLMLVAISMPSSPDAKASGAKVIAFYTKHHNAIDVASICLVYAGVASVLYFTSVAAFLRRRGSHLLATTTNVGAGLFAGGLALGGGLVWAANDAVKHQAPATAQALNIIQTDAFAPLMFAGLTIATASMGVAMLRTRALPKSLGVITTIVGVVSLTWIGSWFALLATGPLTLVIAGYVYARSGADESHQITLPDVPGQRQVPETAAKVTTA